MRRFWKTMCAGVSASLFQSSPLWASKQDEEDQSNLSQIQTTINKIFLTSLQSEFSNLKLFALDAETLGKEIAGHLDIGLGRHICTRFNDGEINLQILDSVRGHKVFILKSFSDQNINDGIMELLLTVSALKKCGAESITALLPFFPYSLPSASVQDTVTEGIDFFTCFGADIVKMLQAMGCDQIITLNTFMTSPKGFAQTSRFMNMQATELVAPYLIHSGIKNPVIVGSQSNRLHLRAISQLHKTFGLFDYQCGLGLFAEKNDYLGEIVEGRDVILFNNIIRTGNHLVQQTNQLKSRGAKNIYCFGFHGLCSNQQLEQFITQLPIKQLILTNSIQHSIQNKKIRTISLAKFLAQIITIVSEEKSLSDFRGSREMLHYAYLTKIKQYNSLIKPKKEGQGPMEAS